MKFWIFLFGTIFAHLTEEDKGFINRVLDRDIAEKRDYAVAVATRMMLKTKVESENVCDTLIGLEKTVELVELSKSLNCGLKIDFIAKEEKNIFNLHYNLFMKDHFAQKIGVKAVLKQLEPFGSAVGLYYETVEDQQIRSYSASLTALKILVLLEKHSTEEKEEIIRLTDLTLETMSEDYRKTSSGAGFIADVESLETSVEFLNMCNKISKFNEIEHLNEFKQSVLLFLLENKYYAQSTKQAYYLIKGLKLVEDQVVPVLKEDVINIDSKDTIEVSFVNPLGESVEVKEFSYKFNTSFTKSEGKIPVKKLSLGNKTVEIKAFDNIFTLKFVLFRQNKFKSVEIQVKTGNKQAETQLKLK